MPPLLKTFILSGSPLLLSSALAAAPMTEASSCENKPFKIEVDGDSGNARTEVFTGVAIYMLNGHSRDQSCSANRQQTITCRHLEQEACSLVAEAVETVSYDSLQVLFQDQHLASRGTRNQEAYVKDTLAEFSRTTNYESWPSTVVPMSSIKRKTRVIYRSPSSYPVKISVSETRDSTNGDRDAARLETEIAIKRVGDASYDFYAYDPAGNLAENSHFPAGLRPSPTVCVSCHYNSATQTVTRFIP